MNRRVSVIISFILAALIVIMVVAIAFISTMTRGSRFSAPPEASESEEIEPVPGYAIPEKPVPSLQEIDESIKRSADKREAVKKVMDEIEKQKRSRNLPKAAEEQDESVAEVPAAEEKKGQTVSILAEKKEVLFPTSAEVKKMRSRGIIAY